MAGNLIGRTRRGRIGGWGVAAVLTAATQGCRSADTTLYPARAGQPAAETIVLDNHWHTALIFRRADLPPALRDELRTTAGRRFVMFGWGDEGFFRAEKVTTGLALQAMFASRGSVLLVVAFDTLPEETFDPGIDIYRLPTSAASVAKTVEFVSTTFRRNGGHVIDAGPGIDGGRFYAGLGRYAFYHTCNQWTADALAAGGQPVSPPTSATAGSVAFQLRQLRGVQKNGRPVPEPTPPNADALRLARGRRP